ncbi:hypothetical protein, partial [Streptomyces sp. NPDC004726]
MSRLPGNTRNTRSIGTTESAAVTAGPGAGAPLLRRLPATAAVAACLALGTVGALTGSAAADTGTPRPSAAELAA